MKNTPIVNYIKHHQTSRACLPVVLFARLEGSAHILLGQLLAQPLELGLGQAVGVIASRGREVLRQAAEFVVGKIYPHIVQHLLKHR